MKAAVIHELGTEDVFHYEDVEDPQIRPRQVLVRIKAASVNRGDLGRRDGTYHGVTAAAKLPLILGWDVSGVIEAVGEEVTDRHVGQRVVATLASGGYAELAAVSARGTVPFPDILSFEEAASIPIVFLTSWFALLKVAELQEGETALIQSAGSGVGMAGIQIAKYAGARVITTSSSREKLDRAGKLGADEAINYREQDVLESVMALTEGNGVNVVLDGVGGETLANGIACLAPLGRLVTVGNTSESPTTIDPGLLFQRTLTVRGFTLAGQMVRGGVMPELVRIMDLFGEGRFKAVVDRVFPLSGASEAHRYVSGGGQFGKVILRP
jgi:NADPH2:quinone reductase